MDSSELSNHIYIKPLPKYLKIINNLKIKIGKETTKTGLKR